MGGRVVIVGAGVAGLTLAKQLAVEGVEVAVIERENVIGGLAKSFAYPSGAVFDVGPHRFHTDSEEVHRFILETLEDNALVIGRNSQLHIYDKYIPWPLTMKSLLALPPRLYLKSALDMAMPRRAKTEAFDEYIIERYGKTLYDIFFKPYTEKFLDLNCKNLHRNWAQAGINRATIDKQIKTDSLLALAKSTLFSKTPDTKFLYPKQGGIMAFSDALAASVRAAGGRVLLSASVAEIVERNGKIAAVKTDRGEEIEADHVFWSGSLKDLMRIGRAPRETPALHYLSTLFFNYLASERSPHDFQWCYYGDKNLKLNRIALPRNFNPDCVPEGKEAICVEVTCREGSDDWCEPDRLDGALEAFMLRAGLLRSLDCMEEYHIERVRETYPVYTLNYLWKLKAVFGWVADSWSNITLIGRTGRFWYNNMDHSIAASLKVARRFLEDRRSGEARRGDAYSEEDRSLGEAAS